MRIGASTHFALALACRYMALNDLIAEARKETFLQLDEGLETQTVNQVLELMNDKNGEVKNMAVRW